MLRVSFPSSMRVRINHVVCLIRTWRRQDKTLHTHPRTYSHTYMRQVLLGSNNQLDSLSPTTIFRRRDIERNWTERPRGLRVVCCVHTMSKQLLGMTMTMAMAMIMLMASRHTARPLLLRRWLPVRKMLDALPHHSSARPILLLLPTCMPCGTEYTNPTCMDDSCPCITKPTLRATQASRGVAAVRPGRILHIGHGDQRHGNICVNAPYTTDRAGRVSKTGLEIRKSSTVVFIQGSVEKNKTRQEGGGHRGPTPAVLVSHGIVDPDTRGRDCSSREVSGPSHALPRQAAPHTNQASNVHWERRCTAR
ncbi:hypothetical protein J3F84DRAFT_389846 [Trichoderma pleuroticola]